MPNNRSIKDADLAKTTTYGNVGFTANGNTLDLGQVLPYPVLEQVMAQIQTTAGTNAANNKNINITVQHSDVDLNANFANIAELAPLTIMEVATGYAATTRNIALPPGTKRYIRLRIAGEANGGNANDGTATLRLLL